MFHVNGKPRWWAIWLATALAQVALGKICLALGTIGGTASPFWLPAGLVMALSLRLGYGALPGIFLGELFLGYFFMPGSLWQYSMIAAGNVLEGAAICYLAPRWMNGVDPLGSVKNFFAFFAASAVGSAQNGLIGVTSLGLAGIIPFAAFPDVMLSWSVGDLGGTLIVAPLVLAWYPMDWSEWRDQRRFEFLMLLLVTLVVSGAVFGSWFDISVAPLAFLLLPFLVWGAFRFGASSCTLLNAAMMAVVIWGTTRGYGPFASSSATESLMLLQLFTSVMIVTSLLTLIVNRDRQRITGELRHHAALLEQRVAERTADLKKAFEQLEEAHETVNSSIQYASRIQRSILPPEDAFKAMIPEHFVLWKPRDVVGGDIYWCKPWGEGVLVILGDCTGHGVPGAFMTMLSSGALERAIRDVAPGNVGELLQHTHQNLQNTLNQGGEQGHSDDGIEMGVCYLNKNKSKMVFAGARFDLYILKTGAVEIIKGSKSGMGYRGIPYDQEYASREIALHSDATYYLASDGIIDQVGEVTGWGVGRKRLMQWMIEAAHLPLEEQKNQIFEKFLTYQGCEKRRDDVALIGLKV